MEKLHCRLTEISLKEVKMKRRIEKKSINSNSIILQMHMLVHCSFTQILKICRSNMKFQAYSIAPKERSLSISGDETANQLEYPIVDQILYHVH